MDVTGSAGRRGFSGDPVGTVCSPGEERTMKVREIMRIPVGRILPTATVAEALARMREPGVASLLVEDAGGSFWGTVRLADLTRSLAEGKGVSADAVGKGLSSQPVTATPEMDVARVAELMRYKGLDDIMVLDGTHLVGTVSLAEAGGVARPVGE